MTGICPFHLFHVSSSVISSAMTNEADDAAVTERHPLVEIAIAVASRVHEYKSHRLFKVVRLDGVAQSARCIGDEPAWAPVNTPQTEVVPETRGDGLTPVDVPGQFTVAEAKEAGVDHG